MPLNLFYTMVQKKSKMTKNSNQGGPALTRSLPRAILTFHHPVANIFGNVISDSEGRDGSFIVWRIRSAVPRLVRQECERQKCERHQCEANSANANSAKGSTVRMRQECECQMCECQQCDATSVRKKCDSSANANSANRICSFHWFWLDLDGTEKGSKRKLECARWHVVLLELISFQLTFTFNTWASMFVFM